MCVCVSIYIYINFLVGSSFFRHRKSCSRYYCTYWYSVVFRSNFDLEPAARAIVYGFAQRINAMQ